MSRDDIEEEIVQIEKGFVWNKPYFYFYNQIFFPKICEIQKIDSSCNTVIIDIDGGMSADLIWNESEKQAQNYIEKGFKILWRIDLGLFDRLRLPLSNQTQFLSLVLSLEHFRDTLWKNYRAHTLGLCLYQGPADFSQQIQWDEQLQKNFMQWWQNLLTIPFNESHSEFKSLFTRDVAAEYLTWIANRMPDAMPLFAIFEIDPMLHLTLEAQLTHRERFDRLHLIVNGGHLPALFEYKEANVGVCLPSYQMINPDIYSPLETVFNKLLQKKIHFRTIPEAFLINEWDGLDYLIVSPKSLSTQSLRKLKGFCAASGTVVTIDEPIHLPHEMDIDHFFLINS